MLGEPICIIDKSYIEWYIEYNLEKCLSPGYEVFTILITDKIITGSFLWALKSFENKISKVFISTLSFSPLYNKVDLIKFISGSFLWYYAYFNLSENLKSKIFISIYSLPLLYDCSLNSFQYFLLVIIVSSICILISIESKYMTVKSQKVKIFNKIDQETHMEYIKFLNNDIINNSNNSYPLVKYTRNLPFKETSNRPGPKAFIKSW